MRGEFALLVACALATFIVVAGALTLHHGGH